MGVIGTVVGIVDGELSVELGGGEVVEVPIYSASGVQCYPIPGDIALLAEDDSDFGYSCVGFYNRNGFVLTNEGDIMIQSRGKAISVHLKSDDSLMIQNTSGSIEMRANGSVVINEALEVLP